MSYLPVRYYSDLPITATNSDIGNPSAGLFANSGNINVGSRLAVRAVGDYLYGIYGAGGSINTGSSADITTSGRGAYGAYVFESYMYIGEGTAINTAGETAHGVYAQNNSYMYIGESATITTSGTDAYGAYTSNAAIMHIGEGTTINTTGQGAHGSYANASTMYIGEGITITTLGFGAYGAYVSNVARMDIGEGITITTLGNSAHGAYASNAARMNIVESATITTSGSGAHGAYANASTMYIGGGVTINTGGETAHGVYAQNNSYMEIGESATITTSGTDAYGAYASNAARMDFLESATITTSGSGAHGAYAFESVLDIGWGAAINTSGSGAYGAYASKSTMDIGWGAAINTSGTDAHGAYVSSNASRMDIGESATITTSGTDAYGAYVSNAARMYIGEGTTINTTGQGAHGAYANASTMYIGEGATINTTGQGAHAVYSNNIFDYWAPSITLNGGTISATGTDAYAIMADSDAQVTGDGVFYITGDVRNNGNGLVELTIRDDSAITGDLVNVSGSGDLNVIMDSASSVTGTAKSDGAAGGNVINIAGGAITAAAGNNTLEVENGGTVNLTGTTANANGGELIATASSGSVLASSATLTGGISNSGSGDLNVTLDSGSALTGSVLTNAAGATNLNISATAAWIVSDDSDLGLGNLDNGGVVGFNANAAYMTVKAGTLGANGGSGGLFDMKMDVVAQASDKLKIADTAGGSYTITAQADDAALATSGLESFNLVEIGGASTASFALTKEMELGAWMYSIRQIAFGASGTAVQVYSVGLSNAASAAVNTFASGYLMGYAETNTLIQRLGELRDTTMQNGIWARVHGGKFNTDGMRHGKEFDLDYGGVQIGYDRKLATAWDGSLYAGIMFGYAKGDIDFDYSGGDGDVKSKTLGVYGAYKQADGFYVDAVLKYQWIDYDFNTYNSVGTKVTANEPDGGGFGLSLEVGKRFELKNNWFVEPQAQLSYQKQDGGTFYMSNGLRLGVDDWTSLLGRLGVRVGYERGAHSFYAKLSWVKEFDGDFDFTANGVGFKDSFGDNWWVYGIGYTSKINGRNSLYLDLERSSGGVFEQDWAVKGGWRVEM